VSDERFELDGSAGFPIRVDVTAPAEPVATVLICHGFKGFSGWGFFPWLAERLAGVRLRAVRFDFSDSGMTAEGAFADQPGFEGSTFGRQLSDVDTVVRECRARGWLTRGYGLFGHSRGGGVAVLHAARNDDVRALVTWASISTVRRWSPEEMKAWRDNGWLDVRNTRTGEILRQNTDLLEEIEREGDDALNIERAAGAIRAPWLILHGTQDETVSVQEARTLQNAAAPGEAELVTLETGHTFGATHPLRERDAHLERAVALTVDHFVHHIG
jgi:uncharacterized protein